MSDYENIPFEIPEGWVWCRLDELAFYKKGPFGSSLTKSMFILDKENAYKVYEQKNAINKNANLGHYFISYEKYLELQSFEVKPQDIIVSCAGTIGETYVKPNNIRQGIINQALMIIRLHNIEIAPFYLLYFDFILKAEAAKDGKGTAIKNIPPFDVLKNYLIPIPPVAEQNRIIKEVKKWLSIVDSIDNQVDDIQNLLVKTKSKILDLAISGKLVPQDPTDEPAIELLKRINPNFTPCDNSHYENLPENWIEIPINVICNMYQPQTIATTELNPNGKYLVYGANGIIGKYDYYNHSESEILLTCRGATCGNINISEPYSWINGNAMVMHLKEEYCQFIDRNWFIYFFKSINKDNLITGTAQPQITQVSLKKLHVNLPPLGEQKRIANKISKIWSMIETITAEL